MKSERIRETQWNSCRDGLCSALTSVSPEYTSLFPPRALLSLLSSCFTPSTAARGLRLPRRPCGASKRANVGFPLLARCAQLRVSPTGSSWCQAGCGHPLVPPPPHTHTTYSETRGWPRSGLLPSGLPRSGEETDASAPFYGKVFSG